MALPLLTDPSRPQAWQQGRALPAGEAAPAPDVRPVPGYAGYFVDGAGVLFRAAYTDRCNRKHGRYVPRTRSIKGSSQHRLFVGGRVLWLSENKLRKLLEL
jgi:hypothetical protein